MPNFKQMRDFVSYVKDYNTKDIDDDGTLGNLIDPNYYDVKAIKEDNALRIFQKRKDLSATQVADIYRDAKSLRLLERRDSSNSTHVQGVGIVLTDDGRHFLETAKPFGWQRGKWHVIVKYYGSWSIVLSLIALIVSIIALWQSQ